jgi:mono/diheme cytochrome c family protein
MSFRQTLLPAAPAAMPPKGGANLSSEQMSAVAAYV